MSDEQQNDPQQESVASDDTGCQFPIGPGQVCGQPKARSGKPGRPSEYCANPEHTRAKAYLARRAVERGAAGGSAQAVQQVETVVPERPVTDGRRSFGALLSQFEEIAAVAQRAAAEQQAQLAAILERATEVVRTVADPDAAGYEVEQIQRETSVQIAEAQTAQAAADREARAARKAVERETELRAQADAAAEEALAELERIKVEATEATARITAETEATVTEHQQRAEQAATAERAAREELDRLRTETAETVAAAQAAAEKHKQETIAERDRILAERDNDMRQQIKQARADAAEQVEAVRVEAQTQIETAQQAADERIAAAEREAEKARADAAAAIRAAQQDVTDATTAKTRAETDQSAAERRATEARADVERLRGELDQQRVEYHQELTELRAEIRSEREDMRRERAAHADQLSGMFATVTEHQQRAEQAATAERAAREELDRLRTETDQAAQTPAQQGRRGRAKGEQ